RSGSTRRAVREFLHRPSGRSSRVRPFQSEPYNFSIIDERPPPNVPGPGRGHHFGFCARPHSLTRTAALTQRQIPDAADSRAGTGGPGWRQALAAIAARSRPEGDPLDTLAGQILYVIDLAASTQAMALALHLLRQEQKQNGDWGLPKAARIASGRMEALPEADRVILGRLAGARPVRERAWSASVEMPF